MYPKQVLNLFAIDFCSLTFLFLSSHIVRVLTDSLLFIFGMEGMYYS